MTTPSQPRTSSRTPEPEQPGAPSRALRIRGASGWERFRKRADMQLPAGRGEQDPPR
ncbi:hypothetical protein [Streptomyces sp. NPDC048340]|uniref:hypothetical protein n=1 Tax=Streptomyces sp. NPDC048340 TaxID=3365537 RepID=UPI0037114419